MADRILDMLREGKSNYHPLVSILSITDECPEEDFRLKLDCHRTIAKYVEAERKSVEVKNDGENLYNLHIDVSGE